MASSRSGVHSRLTAEDRTETIAPGPSAERSLPVSPRRRAVVEAVRPQVDGGRYPAKAAVGDQVAVSATAYCDGHDLVTAEIRYRHQSERTWCTAPMTAVGNDRWEGAFAATELGSYHFAVQAAVDDWRTWRRDLLRWAEALEDVSVELEVGAGLLERAAARARGRERALLAAAATALRRAPRGLESDVDTAVDVDHGGTVLGLVADETLAGLVWRLRHPADTVASGRLAVVADPERARFSTWYELFPRSAADAPGRHGTLADAEKRLDYVARLGADVVYLPPIHPVGRTNRKGRDGAPTAGPGDPGSPWAIGAAEGGHTAIHPELGTMADFERLVSGAADRDMDIALDLAFQCSPDHPWVAEHPSWFRRRPDGSIRYAENPPKRYEDIYPLDFECEDWAALWQALLEVVQFWINHGVRVFRVDNPHTKPFAFWEWLLASVKAEDPQIIFLAEAFTRPAVMGRLAKIGFTQSYTYFTWRTSRWELETYLTELTEGEAADYFRPNFWPNTPDILPEHLQSGRRGAFLARLVLAATLSASYGIYGPAFELGEHEPRHPGSEEYLHSEKYELRAWPQDPPDSLAAFVARINAVRRSHPALQHNRPLTFHRADNEQLIAYSKARPSPGPGAPPDVVLVVVNLDSAHTQSGWLDLDLDALGLGADEPFAVHDLLTDARYQWQGPRAFVLLDPEAVPAHVFAVTPGPAVAP